MPKDKEALARMIAKRDGISVNEAHAAIRECTEWIENAISHGRFEEAFDILREELGLEPDYMDILF